MGIVLGEGRKESREVLALQGSSLTCRKQLMQRLGSREYESHVRPYCGDYNWWCDLTGCIWRGTIGLRSVMEILFP